MKITRGQTAGWEAAFKGMRNPKNSWSKSDSIFGIFSCDDDPDYDVASDWTYKHLKNQEYDEEQEDYDEQYDKYFEKYDIWLLRNGVIQASETSDCYELALLGHDDLSLAQRLIFAGPEHCKFLRQITISCDITAPLYWWKEMDTYKIGTVADSTSTMHKLTSVPITIDSFEMNDLDENMMMYENDPYNPDIYMSEFWDMLINDLEHLRKKYNETKDQRYWKELIRLLPESWLQTRTWSANYAVLRNIYLQRKNHKLSEWHTFCDWIKTLPYANELILCKID